MVSNKGRSRVTTVLGIFVSLLVLGLVLHHFNSSLVRQHFPKQLCRHASGKKDTEVVVAVKTSPDNYATREAIRNSMASLAVRAVLPWQVVFYTGFSEDAETSRALRREALKGDLIISRYEHLELNTVKLFLDAIKWVHERCEPELRYFIHTNDSTLVDLVAVHELISNQTGEDRYFHCAPVKGVRVDRNVSSPTYLSLTQFADDVFPIFCEGDAFIINATFLKPLVLASEAIPQYPFLGAYVTGHLPVIARVGHKNLSPKILILDGKPEKVNCARTERIIFLSNITRINQWKPLWLKSLICYESLNVTTNLIAERIVQNVHINVPK
ncbi:acetylgalactosaminyl-O-glycosyl-glycoprotein beta-1,3-N-acetylglucosaminyltransferase-like [Haemaphysalis longicornis]